MSLLSSGSYIHRARPSGQSFRIAAVQGSQIHSLSIGGPTAKNRKCLPSGRNRGIMCEYSVARSGPVQSEISDFGSEMQDSSNFNFL
ncbi:MAG: hypothetical protein DMG14_23920 [Acidobacteria bacterium]|nr:MAG: hypothetical protein DMG14_23920 [Acidobacteriota bacterium]